MIMANQSSKQQFDAIMSWEINRIDSWTGGNGQRYNFTVKRASRLDQYCSSSQKNQYKSTTNAMNALFCKASLRPVVLTYRQIHQRTQALVCASPLGQCHVLRRCGKTSAFLLYLRISGSQPQRSLINPWPYFTKPGNSSPESRSVYSFTSVRLKSITLICITVLVCNRVHLFHSITYTNQNVPL